MLFHCYGCQGKQSKNYIIKIIEPIFSHPNHCKDLVENLFFFRFVMFLLHNIFIFIENLPIFCGHSANFIRFPGVMAPVVVFLRRIHHFTACGTVKSRHYTRYTLYTLYMLYIYTCIHCKLYTVYVYLCKVYKKDAVYFQGLHFLNIELSGCVFKVSRFYLNLSFILGFSLVLNA